jgi:imidazolonepropionase-like amidohydrolase
VVCGGYFSHAALENVVSTIAALVATTSQDSARGVYPVTAFVDVSVVPMDTERILAHHTVVVHNGVISVVGHVSTTPIPDGAHIIDGSGKFLMPGLADMHVHISNEDEFLLFIANGVTTVRDMFGNEDRLAWRAAVERGDILGPTIYTSGPIIDGNPPWIEGSVVVETAEEAELEVVREKAAGYDFIKVYDLLSPDAYNGIVEAARKHGIPVVGHVPDAVGLSGVLAAGQASIEHLRGYGAALAADPDKVTHGSEDWAMADTSRMQSLAEATYEVGVWNCPTLVVGQKWVQPEEQRALFARPVMRYIAPAVRDEWNPGSSYLSSFPAEKLAAVERSHKERLLMTRALLRSGASLLLGTDCGNPFVVAGFSAHEELANLADAGLTPYEALQTGTRRPAEFLTASGEFGVIAAGARADLILTDGNPLEDIGVAAEPAGVMVRGVWLTSEELAERLEQLAKSYEQQVREGKSEKGAPDQRKYLTSLAVTPTA